MYSDEQLDLQDSDEQSPLANSGGSTGFSFPSHGADYGQLLSAAISQRQLLHVAAGGYRIHANDNDDESDDDGDDEDEDDDDEELYGESDDEGENDEYVAGSSEGDIDK